MNWLRTRRIVDLFMFLALNCLAWYHASPLIGLAGVVLLATSRPAVDPEPEGT